MGEKEGVFYSIERSDFDFYAEPSFGGLLLITVVTDPNQDFYSRQVYSFFDLTGQVGGLYGIVDTICRIFVGMISSKLFVLSVLSHLYQVEDHKMRMRKNIYPLNQLDSRKFDDNRGSLRVDQTRE